MIEIRIHGRGGQGSVTAAELIAAAAFYDGKFPQAFPNFGVERRGAPVAAYVRIAEKFIRLRSQVYEPDFVIIQDASLIDGVAVFAGLKKGGVALINSEKKFKDFKTPRGVEVVTIDAAEIAKKIIGKPIINTVLLGAFSGLSGVIKLESVERAIRERFSDQVIAEKNIAAAREGFAATKKN